MFIRGTLLFVLCNALFAAQAPHLSEPQVIRIANKAARSALHRDLSEFSCRAVYYDVHDAKWSVFYKSIKAPPSELCVRVSDTTRETEVIFGDKLIHLDINTSNQPMKPTAPLRYDFSVFATTPCRGLSLSR
jgi:hypothetical protein